MRQQRGAIVCIRVGHALSSINTKTISASAATVAIAISAIFIMLPASGMSILPFGGTRPVRAKQRVQVPLRVDGRREKRDKIGRNTKVR